MAKVRRVRESESVVGERRFRAVVGVREMVCVEGEGSGKVEEREIRRTLLRSCRWRWWKGNSVAVVVWLGGRRRSKACSAGLARFGMVLWCVPLWNVFR